MMCFNNRWFSNGIRSVIGEQNYIKARIQMEKIRQWSRRIGTTAIDSFLHLYSKSHPELNFVQIASSDGVFGDPIHTYIVRDRWAGLLVEPIPQVFELLKFTYKGNEIPRFGNCAVGLEAGSAPFYTLPSEKFGTTMEHRNEVACKKGRGMSRLMSGFCLFLSYLEVHAIDEIRLIHRDTEGYDFEVLKQVNFDLYRTEVVIFEHVYFGKALENCYANFRDWGLTMIKDKQDTLAHQTL